MGLTKGATSSSGGGSTSLGPDLTAIAALSPPTAAFGRSLLSAANVAALQALIIPAGTVWATAAAAADSGWLLCDGTTVTGGQTTYPALWARIPAGWKSGANIVLPNLCGRTIIGAGTGVGLTARTLGTAYSNEESHILTPAETAVKGHPHAHTIGASHTIATSNTDVNHYHGIATSGEAAHTHNVNPLEYRAVNFGSQMNALVLSGNGGTAINVPVTAGTSHSHGGGTYWQSDTGNGSSGGNLHAHPVTGSVSITGSVTALVDGASGTAHNNMQPSYALNYQIKVH